MPSLLNSGRTLRNAWAIGLILTGPAWAADTEKESATRDVGQLEEVTVTAQKRSQSAQDVPISIAAFTADSLKTAGVTDVREIQQLDSSLSISSASGGTAVPFMRGVGNPGGIAVGNESSVPMYIDEVYYARLSLSLLSLANIDRVEVLKGPQGTLFGRNASGGLINIFTRTPNRDRAVVETSVGYGNYNTVSGKLYASTPLGENLAADFSVVAMNQGDGWGTNVHTGKDVWRARNVALRSKIVATPTDSTQLTLIGWYVNAHNTQGSTFAHPRGTIAGTPDVCNFGPGFASLCPIYGPAQPIDSRKIGFYDIDTNFDPSNREEGYGGSLKIEQETSFADLVSISSYRRGQGRFQATGWATSLPWISYVLNSSERQVTQEFQVKSKSHSSFDWIMGAFYMNYAAGYKPVRVFGDALGPGTSGSDLNNPTLNTYLDVNGIQTSNSYASFGQATFHVIPDTTNLTLGLRYTIDKLRGQADTTLYVPPANLVIPITAPYDERQTSKKLTYKAVVDHSFTKDIMAFVSYSRGYKAGTYGSQIGVTTPATKPEVIDAYEVGLKTEFFDKRLRLNAAIFQNSITDAQVQIAQINPDTGILGLGYFNAAAARSRGFELTGLALVADGLSVRFGANVLESKFTSFPSAPFLRQLTGAPFGNVLTLEDASGKHLAQSPTFKGNVGVNYDFKTKAGGFNLDVGASYTTSYFWEPDNIQKTPGYALVNAAIVYRPAFNDQFSIRVWGKNITGHKYYATILSTEGGSGTVASPAEPRTYGIELSYKF